MDESQSYEKFNAALDNLKNILNLKKMTQDYILKNDYSKAGETLALWNYDIIAWKKKVSDNSVEEKLLSFDKKFEQLSNLEKNVPFLLKKVVKEWFLEVMKYSYEIWFSKIESDPWADLEAI